jgi:SsrA-binding protein
MATYLKNRRAHYDFEIRETLEAGLMLSGHEAKAIRAGKGKLDGAFVQVRGGEAYLVGASISPYQVANTPTAYDPEQPRKLLLSRKEIDALEQQTERERLTAIPLRLYNSGRNIKLEVGIAKGKRKPDKRETIKARDTKRDIERTLKGQAY